MPFCNLAWEFLVTKASGHNDRVGFIESAVVDVNGGLNSPLNTFAIYIQSNPGTYYTQNCVLTTLQPFNLQAKTGDRIGFMIEPKNQWTLTVFVNSKIEGRFTIKSGKYYPAVGTQNGGSSFELCKSVSFSVK